MDGDRHEGGGLGGSSNFGNCSIAGDSIVDGRRLEASAVGKVRHLEAFFSMPDNFGSKALLITLGGGCGFRASELG